ncbi:MAG: NAD(P)H-hydrate dehydratase [Candidatus Omnitrophota bacterium]|nr:NAD(P)H-hydrate dehydratase [Candidatus Omnitrophota bacterium]
MRLPTLLLRRKPNSHKGFFGHIFILGGSKRFSGAAVLCAEAAYRSGAGLVTLSSPFGITQAIIKIKPKEVMLLPLPETKSGSFSFSGYKRIENFLKDVNILVVGPGLTQDKSTQGLVRKLIANTNKPIVIDADGLNALAGHLDSVKASRRQGVKDIIITPHPGEMSWLLGTSVEEIQGKRKQTAKKFAKDYKVTVVLKGHNTIVTDYQNNFYINKTGNPGMATAGSGDVLTGIIAAFLGQGLSTFEAAKYAVYLHGLAGDLAADEKTQLGMIASDIIKKIPEAIRLSS